MKGGNDPGRGSVVSFGLAPEIVGAILVGVLDAGPKERTKVVIREAVVDRSTLAAGLKQGSVAEQSQLVADGRNRKAGVIRELGHTEPTVVGQRVDDSDPRRIRDRGKESAQAFHDPLGELLVF